MDHFLQRQLASGADVMTRRGNAEDVAYLVLIAACDRARDAAIEIEAAGNGDLGQRWRTLDLVLRSQIAAGKPGTVQVPYLLTLYQLPSEGLLVPHQEPGDQLSTLAHSEDCLAIRCGCGFKNQVTLLRFAL